MAQKKRRKQLANREQQEKKIREFLAAESMLPKKLVSLFAPGAAPEIISLLREMVDVGKLQYLEDGKLSLTKKFVS